VGSILGRHLPCSVRELLEDDARVHHRYLVRVGVSRVRVSGCQGVRDGVGVGARDGVRVGVGVGVGVGVRDGVKG